jgi:prepilin-type N-terminal cleavage/methylation domain-containing protein
MTESQQFEKVPRTRFTGDAPPAWSREHGFTLVEVLIVIGVLALLTLLATPTAAKLIRRSHDLAGYSTVRQALAYARLQAVNREANVVVEISLTTDKRIRLRTFQDRANDAANPLPADEAAAAGNLVQDTGTFGGSPFSDEPTLSDVTLPSGIRLWKKGATKNDLVEGAAFDTYNGDSALVNRIVFLSTGGISTPESTNSAPPTATGGRGIYVADACGKNFFRITVDGALSGKLRVDKYVEGAGYVPSEWVWQ